MRMRVPVRVGEPGQRAPFPLLPTTTHEFKPAFAETPPMEMVSHFHSYEAAFANNNLGVYGPQARKIGDGCGESSVCHLLPAPLHNAFPKAAISF